jgi:hypothetical protein
VCRSLDAARRNWDFRCDVCEMTPPLSREVPITREEIEERMDELARKYVETHDTKNRG